MSDTSQGPGWWLASDGEWYPPESAPAAPPPPPPPTARMTSNGAPARESTAPTESAAEAPNVDAPPTEEPGKRRTRRAVGIAAVVVLLLAAVGVTVSILAGGSSSITSHGTMEVDDFTGDCLLDSGFSDITDGTQVTVTNADGTVIGTSVLSYNSGGSDPQGTIQPGLSTCVYRFTVSVPGGLSRYGISVSHRGTIWFNPTQMAKGPGLSLSSGGTGVPPPDTTPETTPGGFSAS